MSQITLDQWRSLIAVVDAGGYAQAALKLHKSQSAVTYAVQKIENLLNIKAFEVIGRKAVLTPTGQMLYRRAMSLVEEANELERAAHKLSAGWEAEVGIAAEILFPPKLLLTAMQQFGEESPHTRIEIIESVLGGTTDALLSGAADLVITPSIPAGYLAEQLMRVRIVAVAHKDHPLHHYGRELTYRDLRSYRHLVVRDSGINRDRRTVSVEVNQRWTVSQIATSIKAVSMGYGFAWLPAQQISEELQAGTLRRLPLRTGGEMELPLYLIQTNADFAGPGIRRMVEILRLSVAAYQGKNQEQTHE
jgi:DNA-binding transcriptional LysR family regulator